MKIMVIDDSRSVLRLVKGMLQQKGYDVVTAENGELAVEELAQNKDTGLILCDWNMPVMDGLTFLKKVKADNLTSAPIVMMTTENKQEKIEMALSEGASEYIMKPFTEDILLDKIAMISSGV